VRHAIAFLHTAQAHVATFERLLGEAAPGLSARHVVRDDLLADARAVGVCDPALVARVHAAMQEAASGGAKVVACTCSTIGGIAEQRRRTAASRPCASTVPWPTARCAPARACWWPPRSRARSRRP